MPQLSVCSFGRARECVHACASLHPAFACACVQCVLQSGASPPASALQHCAEVRVARNN